jgi:glycosyltransferase involved in cell wall biosynthesis
MGPPPQPEQRERAANVPDLVIHDSTYALEWMDAPWEDVARAGNWLLSLERELRPDVVHINGYAHGALELNAPRIVAAHSCVLSWWQAVRGEEAPPRYDTYRRAVRAGLRGADAVITVSDTMREALETHYGPVPRATVIHNGAPTLPVRSPGPKEPFVLSCGRIGDAGKNVASLARVASRLPWPVRVAGWDAGAHSGVESLGWLGERELGATMDRASIFVSPARYEPFGLSALEAGLRGAALVLGDIPSQREVWDDAALFVDPSDDDALAAAITRLAKDASLRADLAERARARAGLYPSARMATQTALVYQSAMTRKGQRECG